MFKVSSYKSFANHQVANESEKKDSGLHVEDPSVDFLQFSVGLFCRSKVEVLCRSFRFFCRSFNVLLKSYCLGFQIESDIQSMWRVHLSRQFEDHYWEEMNFVLENKNDFIWNKLRININSRVRTVNYQILHSKKILSSGGVCINDVPMI